uniref:Ribosomal protein S3b n=1 Tax=Halteria grandinella TaxID=5974 RepID=A0A7T0M4S7_HALGN|nr:ribosomal protein S3b [Halteria grandinella]QPL16006.1 ribosomal protein S3b [Halteria grandinella]
MMVEQWSSKSHAWVRFLLSLLLKLKNFFSRINYKNKKIIKFKLITNLRKKKTLKFKHKKIFKNNFFIKINNLHRPLYFNNKNNFNDFNQIIFLSFFNTNINKNLIFLKSTSTLKNIIPTYINNCENNFLRFNFFYNIFFFYFNNLILQKKITSFLNNSFYNFSRTNDYTMNLNQTPHLLKFKNWNKTTYFFKNVKKQTHLLNIFSDTKLFFKHLIKLKRNFNFYKILKTDWVSINMAILTKNTIHLNLNTYFKFKKIQNYNYCELSKINLMFNNLNRDLLTETTNFSNKQNKFKNIKQFINKFYLKKNQIFNNSSNIAINFNFKKQFIREKFPQTPFLNTYFNKNNLFIPSNLEFILYLLNNPLVFKFLNKNFKNFNLISFSNINKLLNDFFFYKINSVFFQSNLIPLNNFRYDIKKRILKIFSYSRFPTISSIWHHNVLIRFLEFFTGKKIYFKIFAFLQTSLNLEEKAQCLIWSQKVKYFRKVLGPKLFLNESLQIIYLSLKLKDPFLLSNWMVATMQKISFWKYKTFLRYLKYVLRYFFWVIFKELNVKGVKFQLKGKVSVAGNARTRTVFHSIGFTSHATFNNKILYKLNLIKTFTGVLGLKVWIVF